MTIYKVIHTMQPVSAVSADISENTLYFERDGSAAFSALASQVAAFYNNVPSGSAARIWDYIARYMDRNLVTVSIYELPATSGPTGSPVYSGTYTGDATDAGSFNLPAECAAVLSYNADLSGSLEEVGDTRPKARRRGRLYLGPLNGNTLAEVASGDTDPQRMNTTFLTVCVDAADQFLGSGAVAVGWTWQVFSQTDWLGRNVVAARMDNAYDSQRRRGPRATNEVAVSL